MEFLLLILKNLDWLLTSVKPIVFSGELKHLSTLKVNQTEWDLVVVSEESLLLVC